MGASTTILVIDDLETNLFMLSTLLKREGFSVLTSSSGAEGRRLAKAKQPDLILLDIMMPEENGFQTCELLKSDTATSSIPVVFLSALEDTESKVKGLHLGAVDFVSKPFMREEIMARLRSHLRLLRLEPLMVRDQAARVVEEECEGPGRSGGDASDGARLAGFDYRGAGYRDAPAPVSFTAEIAEGIVCLFAVAPVQSSSVEKDARAFRRLLGYNADELTPPEDALRLMDKAYRLAYPGAAPMPSFLAIINRNASRFSFVAACSGKGFIADSFDVVEGFDLDGDGFGGGPQPLFRRSDRVIKQGMRVAVFLGLPELGPDAYSLRQAVSSTLTLPLEDQAKELTFVFDRCPPPAGGVLVINA